MFILVTNFTVDEGPGVDAFLVPQWGGVVIYNYPTTTNYTGRHSVDVSMECIMKTFVLQLKHLLGISPDEVSILFMHVHHWYILS